MGKIDTSKRFIKLTVAGEDKALHLRPEDIRALCWDASRGITKITSTHGGEILQDEVEETPGVIFDKCDKAMTQSNPVSGKWV